jgi:hypothetical protein
MITSYAVDVRALAILVLLASGCATARPVVPTRAYVAGEVDRYELRTDKTTAIADHRVERRADGWVETITWEGEERVPPYQLSLDPKVHLAPYRPRDVPEMMGTVTDHATFFVAINPRLRSHRHELLRGEWADGADTLVGHDCTEADLRVAAVDRDVATVETDFHPPAAPCMSRGSDNFEMVRRQGSVFLVMRGTEQFHVTSRIARKDGKLLDAKMDNTLDLRLSVCMDRELTQCQEQPPMKIHRQLELHLL